MLDGICKHLFKALETYFAYVVRKQVQEALKEKEDVGSERREAVMKPHPPPDFQFS